LRFTYNSVVVVSNEFIVYPHDLFILAPDPFNAAVVVDHTDGMPFFPSSIVIVLRDGSGATLIDTQQHNLPHIIMHLMLSGSEAVACCGGTNTLSSPAKLRVTPSSLRLDVVNGEAAIADASVHYVVGASYSFLFDMTMAANHFAVQSSPFTISPFSMVRRLDSGDCVPSLTLPSGCAGAARRTRRRPRSGRCWRERAWDSRCRKMGRVWIASLADFLL